MHIEIIINGEQLLTALFAVSFICGIIYLDTDAYGQGYRDARREMEGDLSRHLIDRTDNQ